jgi:YVTN family beta-propeller protein
VTIRFAPLALLCALLAGVAIRAQAPEATAPAAPTTSTAPVRGSEGRLLVLNKEDDTLMVFDEPTHKRLATVKVGDEPHEVAVTPDGRKAYVTNVHDRTVSVVDLKSYAVVATLRPEHADYPHGMAISPDGRRLLLTSEGSHRLYVIDTVRDVVERSITTSQAGSHLIALTKSGHRAWVANRGSDSVSLFELPSLRVLKTIKVGPGPEGIGASANGRWVVAALQKAGQVAVLDASNGQVITRLPAGQVPIRVAFAPAMPIALVTNRASDDVTVLDLAARQVVTTVQVGRRPGGVTFNDRGTRAYVANGESNNVTVFTVPGYERTAEIEAGAGPDGIAFVPAPTAAHPPKTQKKSTASTGGR